MVTATERPAPVAVEIGHAHGVTQAVCWPWPTSDLALLVLHDLGADLDKVRWLCERFAGAGVHVLSIDLPGHGLSEGDLKREGPEVVQAAYRSLCESVQGAVAVVANGASAHLLLSTDLPDPPVAAAFLDPRRDGSMRGHTVSRWLHVPKLVVLSAGAGSEYGQKIIDDTTAWCLRADLVGLGEDSEDREGFEIHVSTLMLKFLLEQAAFELSSRRMAASGTGGVAAGAGDAEEPA
jgi:pimeloyl-ACP methyl ester carboxylesterase